jgi:hypothetical protein
MRKFYLFIFCCAVSNHIFASNLDKLKVIDDYLGPTKICEAFPDKTEHKFEREDCNSLSGCEKWQYTVRTTCNDAAEDPIAIIEFTTDGRVFSRNEMTESKWVSLNSNLFRSYVANVESYGSSVVINDLIEASDSMVVTFEVWRSGGLLSTGTLHIGRGDYYHQSIYRQETTLKPIKETRTERLLE